MYIHICTICVYIYIYIHIYIYTINDCSAAHVVVSFVSSEIIKRWVEMIRGRLLK